MSNYGLLIVTETKTPDGRRDAVIGIGAYIWVPTPRDDLPPGMPNFNGHHSLDRVGCPMAFCDASLLIVPGNESEWLSCDGCGTEFHGFEIVEAERGVRYVKLGTLGMRRLRCSFGVTVDSAGCVSAPYHVPCK